MRADRSDDESEQLGWGMKPSVVAAAATPTAGAATAKITIRAAFAVVVVVAKAVADGDGAWSRKYRQQLAHMAPVAARADDVVGLGRLIAYQQLELAAAVRTVIFI